MKKTFHTPGGPVDRDLSPAEVEDLAARGDAEARRELLLAKLNAIGVHSYTPDQVDAFVGGVSTVAELRPLLKLMAKAILFLADYL